jgi:hypothetical protein
MGTEENIFSLAMYEHPELFHGYDNSIDGGMDNCKIFSMARVCRELASGSRTELNELLREEELLRNQTILRDKLLARKKGKALV